MDGTVLPVEGVIAAVLAGKKLRLKKLCLPFDPSIPKVDIEGLELIYINNIQDVLDHLSGQEMLPFFQPQVIDEQQHIVDRNFNLMIGQEKAKRALEIAASGEHYVLMDGPPGCGKSLLAETFPSILPPLSKEAQLEKISLYQLARASYQPLSTPPYRHPHHSASAVSIIGGGTSPKPGEVSLAHRGVLFLDALGEFSKKTLDMLRQPLENEKVTISRVHSTVTYPAKFIFIAAMNPCSCGYLGSTTHYCTCTEKQIKSYKTRVSGPILDRIDILLPLKPVDLQIEDFKEIESSEEVMKRVMKARERQYSRYGQEICNGIVAFEKLNPLTQQQKHYLQSKAMKKGLSNRVQSKIIRLARTIADLKEEEAISDEDLYEAFSLRKIEPIEALAQRG